MTIRRERLDRWCEHAILGLLLFILVYGPLALGAVRPREFLLIQWLMVPLSLLWVCRLWAHPVQPMAWPPVCWVVVLVVVYAGLRYLAADLEYVARQEWIRVLIYALFLLITLNNVTRPAQFHWVVWTLLILGASISAYAIFQFAANSDRVWAFDRPDVYAKRGSGTYICPNHLAGFLEMVIPFSLAIVLLGRSRPYCKVILGYLGLVMFAGLLVTVSRGGWLASASGLGALLVWWIWRRPYKWWGIALLAGLIISVLIFVNQAKLSQNRLNRMTLAGHRSDVRLLLWKSAWQMWRDHWLWGVGPAHFDARFRAYRLAHGDVQIRPVRVHNDYLNILADWGLVGGALVGIGLIVFWSEFLRAWPSLKRIQDEPINFLNWLVPVGAGGASGLIAIQIHSLVDFNMHIPANAILAITLVALVLGASRVGKSGGGEITMKPLGRWSFTAGILVAALYLTWQNIRRTKEVYWEHRASAYSARSIQHVGFLEKAFDAEPGNADLPYRIGEYYRLNSWDGWDDYPELAEKAIYWHGKAAELNPYDPYSLVRQGMCLDWLGRHEEAEPYFLKASNLDPNGYFITALAGWHYYVSEEYADAKPWLERAKSLYSHANNFITWYYLQEVNRHLARQE